MNDINVQNKIKDMISENGVILFMKGNSSMPRCGFSKAVVDILKTLNVSFISVDVLEDENIRQGIKIFANWPTIPQLYIKGQFIGGCDIVVEMYDSGELQGLLLRHELIDA